MAKVGVVTGGGKGIGKAIAKGLAENGVKVVVCSRTKAELDQVAREIKENDGGGHAGGNRLDGQ